MNTKITNLLAFMLLTHLLACGGAKKALISQQDINLANQKGSLSALYHKAETLKSETNKNGRKELVLVQAKIIKLLSSSASSDVERVLTEEKTSYSLVDKNNLLMLLTKINKFKKIDATSHELLSSKINAELEKTNQSITDAQSLLKSSEGDFVKKLKWLQKIAILSGDNSSEMTLYSKEREKMIEQLVSNSKEMYKKRMFNMALISAKKGNEIDPGNLQFEALLSQSEVGLFEQEFNFALENGKPEVAYQELIDVSDKPIMRQIKTKMKRSILLLANYFASNAQVAYKKEKYYVAYSEFKRARQIQSQLDIIDLGFIQEKEFLELLMSKVVEEGRFNGEKYALLKIIQEFDSSYPQLEEKLNLSNETIAQRATTKLTVSDFKEVTSSNSVVASVGRRIGSKLEKILFEKLGSKVQIVSQLVTDNEVNRFSGVSLMINGEVLQAAIESSTHQGRRNVKVQTGVSQLETEEYIKWKKRKRGDAPAQYIEEKIMEDVTLSVEHVKKIAVAEVAFQVIEPLSKKVLLTDNLVKEANFKGQSTNEYQKGSFHQKYIEANLPSDIKIMDDLASQLSSGLGDTLIHYLEKPEVVFHNEHKKQLDAGQVKLAVELLSNAVVIAINSNHHNDEWMSSLKKMVLEK